MPIKKTTTKKRKHIVYHRQLFATSEDGFNLLSISISQTKNWEQYGIIQRYFSVANLT